MGFGNLGIWEMLVIGLLVLLVFGPRRLPEIARSLGKGLREFKRGMNEIQRELEEAERGTRIGEASRAGTGAAQGPASDRGIEPGGTDAPEDGPERLPHAREPTDPAPEPPSAAPEPPAGGPEGPHEEPQPPRGEAVGPDEALPGQGDLFGGRSSTERS